MSLSIWFAKRLLAIVGLFAISLYVINFFDFIYQPWKSTVSALMFSIIPIGAWLTYRGYAKLETMPSMPKQSLPNGGEPSFAVARGICSMTPEQRKFIEEEIHRITLEYKQSEPEVIPPKPKENPIVPTNPEEAGKEIIVRKILESISSANIKVKVGGSMDAKGNVDIGKFQFVIKSGKDGGKPSVPQQPEKKKTGLSNAGRQA